MITWWIFSDAYLQVLFIVSDLEGFHFSVITVQYFILHARRYMLAE